MRGSLSARCSGHAPPRDDTLRGETIPNPIFFANREFVCERVVTKVSVDELCYCNVNVFC